MNPIDVLNTEILDEIFSYLDDSDIYRCLFVNHRFSAHAIPFLYRTLHLVQAHSSWGIRVVNPYL
jgi:F-box-like